MLQVQVKVVSVRKDLIIMQQVEDVLSDIYTQLPVCQLEINNPLKLNIPDNLFAMDYDRVKADDESLDVNFPAEPRILTLTYDSPNKIFRPFISKGLDEVEGTESDISIPWVLEPMEDFLNVKKVLKNLG